MMAAQGASTLSVEKTLDTNLWDWSGSKQQAYLKASNTGHSNWFGFAVAISGDTVVVGAFNENSDGVGVNGTQTGNTATNSGAAYVFVRNGSNWTQQAYLKASNAQAGDLFGISVAIDGDTIVVGASQEDSAAVGVNGNPANNSATNSGAVYIFTRDGTNWSQQAYLKASNTGAGDRFGARVAIAGKMVIAAATAEDSGAVGVNGNEADESVPGAGAVYVFVRSGANWTQEAYLKAFNPQTSANFGLPVSLNEDTLVVGAPNEASNARGINGNQNDESSFMSGAAYVFVRQGTNWTQQAYLKASNSEMGDRFGDAVTVFGDTVVVGARWEDSGAIGVNGDQQNNSAREAGAAYVFVREGTNWTQQAYLKASNASRSDAFGTSVALTGNTLVVGAIGESSSSAGVNGDQNGRGAFYSGAAYVFVRAGTNWTQQAFVKASTPDLGDDFGFSAGISGNTIVLGALNESSSATGINGDQTNNAVPYSGAAYIFTAAPQPGVSIRWRGEYTYSYQLQATERFENPTWTNVGPARFGPSGTMGFTNAGLSSAQLFYRVVATNGFACTNSGGTNCASAISLGAYPADTLIRQGFQCVPAQCQQVAERSGCGSAWFSIRILENSDCVASLRVKAELQSPPGVNYDLFMYVESCGSLRAVSQRAAGELDSVVNGVPERSSIDDSTTVWIEVRYVGGAEPGNWDLRVMTRACD